MSDLPSNEIQAALYQFFEKTIEAQIEFMRRTGLTLLIKPVDNKQMIDFLKRHRNKKGGLKPLPSDKKLELVNNYFESGKSQRTYCQVDLEGLLSERQLRRYISELRVNNRIE